MKKLLASSLALSFVFMLAGCEKKQDTNDPVTQGETTTPHSMEAEPVTPANQIHDDLRETSAPVAIEQGTSSAQTGHAQSNP
ncbi:hypothetical protein IAE19_04905 [Acinetobacter sp. S40]|uniref:hypothetical protein n=1 Tax=unclassified Acinetobacter TaxID=196816 RepID=UPI00190A0185|nr:MULTISPECIES: hypothetical protein [unclassified Acinetobacter]MBJ9984780.1 hypothetical protein [Acinetobacter sp. S40]MBK0062545.1 hypothetical protein [Acinetobacter sp. S55]MBK0066349.1 hypothetical protein [Acinetobacter sp. S54]